MSRVVAAVMSLSLVFAGFGCAGDAGAPGPKGEPGADGVDGVNGTNGTNGENGTNGTDGTNGAPGAASFSILAEIPTQLRAEITEASLGAQSVVKFSVKDGAGRGAAGLTTSQLRFAVAKLQKGTNGNPDVWVNYITRKATAGTVNKTQGNFETTGTLVDNKDGTYAYTFKQDLTAAKDPVTNEAIALEPTLLHRVAIQLSGSVNGASIPICNEQYDFVPNGGTAPASREIVATASCDSCHTKLALHGGGRYDTQNCVMCHNPQSTDPDTGNSVDFPVMIHKIHAAHYLAEQNAPAYKIIGYGNTTHDYSEVTYPQDLRNCRKCHNGAIAATAQGDNWKTRPSQEACGACHTTVAWASHMGGQTDNSKCANCHDANYVDSKHVTDNATANNPSVPKKAGGEAAYQIAYEIKEVTVSATREPVVTFRIMKDGAALDLAALPADLTGGPSFVVAYALAQGAVTAPADYNNLGKKAAQPARITLADVVSGAKGTLSAKDANGYYTATLKDATALFPVGATLRAVGMDGYYSQKDFYGAGLSLARHAISPVKAVTGDTARRVVVDDAKCGNCHEWLELHGGNRVVNTGICVMCHTPNLSSSGRGANPANMTAAEQAKAVADGYDPAAPLTFPEATNNLKEMVHAIHASAKRDVEFRFVRDRGTSGVYYFNWSEVTFPGSTGNCLSCHKPGTFDAELPTGVLATTDRTTTGNDLTTADVGTARTNLPNTTDLVSSAVTSTCHSCHTTALAVAHMEQNGGVINAERSTVGSKLETCTLCHGNGRSADVASVHGRSSGAH